ncbi:DUF1350 family protein [Cyanobium sp. N.Huapi 1H5]|uniref:DUF1350 family protein n=1 Tax=Cyanobium sp. N.Huapi 1H5 TaxID=2823719 RepID=UPI0020CC897A|nr:DUF1350 family protein [Cyanobium sp. N.Huapi 1H5]MCP9836975.1 DUF1350 family protein [Cyanobium sp. N.Huapi 1H5]
MTAWRQQGELWRLEPPGRPRGLIEFIGGSYLAASPQLSYRRCLEALAARGWRIHAWSYVPGFDHQAQANAAWRLFRQQRELDPLAPLSPGGAGSPLIRLGHSLGCKLHLLAPDGGRRCDGLVALSFNNFSAERSIPFLAELGQQFRFRSEFSPSPEDTLRQIGSSYSQPRNLVVRFSRDTIDQSGRLIGVLQARAGDASTLLELPGDHLTPASGGLRKQFLGEWADDPARQRSMERLAEQISAWSGTA